jgi:hypothetical protein
MEEQVGNQVQGGVGQEAKGATSGQAVVRPLDEGATRVDGSPKKQLALTLVGVLVIVLLGVGSGYGLVQVRGGSKGGGKGAKVVSFKGDQVTEAGIADESQFPDKTQGVMEENDGSVTEEGTHMLVREGGPDQTAYLTSSVVDLNEFVGKKVEIWGETFTAQTAGWLMDVGYVKVIE